MKSNRFSIYLHQQLTYKDDFSTAIMSKWLASEKFSKSLQLKNPILIEGLPGIGNVGKIAIDYIIENVKPTLIYQLHSHSFPHSVFLTEENTIELPSVKIYKHKGADRDILLLGGDVQPLDEVSSYEFCEQVLNFAEKVGCKEIITLGGIGMPNPVKEPKVFGAVTSKIALKKYSKYKNIDFKINQKIEAIVGATGLLLGLANLRGIEGVSLLAETRAHQMHLGFNEAKILVENLNNILDLKVDVKELEKATEESGQKKTESKIEKEIKPTKNKLLKYSEGGVYYIS